MELTFNYHDERVMALCNEDQVLKKIILLLGDISLSLETNHFKSLVMSIVGQQLSSKVAAVIRQRVADLIPTFSPEAVNALDIEELRSAGISYTKVSYIKDLCKKILQNQLDFKKMKALDDAEVIRSLTAVKGIGRWTAEMFLIFSLGRLDVLSLGDAGLQRAAKWLYQLEDRPNHDYLSQYSDGWAPLRSVVSLYLWSAIDNGLVDSGKSVDEIMNAFS